MGMGQSSSYCVQGEVGLLLLHLGQEGLSTVIHLKRYFTWVCWIQALVYRYTSTHRNGPEFQLLRIGSGWAVTTEPGSGGALSRQKSQVHVLHFRFVEELGFPPTCYLFSTCDTVEECGQQCKYSILGMFTVSHS
jgi:hypothetical protein